MNTPNNNSVRNTIDLVTPGKVIRVDINQFDPLKKLNELNQAFFQAGRDEAIAKAEVKNAEVYVGKMQADLAKAQKDFEQVDKNMTWWAEWHEAQETHWQKLAEQHGINVDVIKTLTMKTEEWAAQMERKAQAENQWRKYQSKAEEAEANVKAAEEALLFSKDAAECAHNQVVKAREAWLKENKKVEKTVLKPQQ